MKIYIICYIPCVFLGLVKNDERIARSKCVLKMYVFVEQVSHGNKRVLSV